MVLRLHQHNIGYMADGFYCIFGCCMFLASYLLIYLLLLCSTISFGLMCIWSAYSFVVSAVCFSQFYLKFSAVNTILCSCYALV